MLIETPKMVRPTAAECDSCECTAPAPLSAAAPADRAAAFSGALLWTFGIVVATVVALAVLGEWFAIFDRLRDLVPWWAWATIVLVSGYSIFRNVIRAALRGRVTSHTLMTVGLIGAVAVSQWPAAVLVVFFMRLADQIEHYTAIRARQAVRDLSAMAPETARVERDGAEIETPIGSLRIGDIVVVRPGEKIPVDGEVVTGQATVNQAAITGESMPVEAGRGAHVFAASFAQLGSLRVRATGIGADSTFGRIIRLVEEAERHRADVQRLADRFATWYLPVVAAVAAGTMLFSGNLIATAAVLMVACSCSFAIATPIAMIASIGAAACRGLLIKGDKHVESLAKANVVLLDKTGTLTVGKPSITDVILFDPSLDRSDLLQMAATVERYSEHPLAEAVREAAAEIGLRLGEPTDFEAVPGRGVRMTAPDGRTIAVGSRRLITGGDVPGAATALEAEGNTLLFVARDDRAVGVLAAQDTMHPEVPAALDELKALGIERIELLTGDNEATAAALAGVLRIAYRANLLPEDKIAVVRKYQAEGCVVVMVGDGVNDAPALAQADVGIAMGAAGSPVAIEAAHVALMREDWGLVPEVFRIARRTMGVVRLNLLFTAAYNLIGLALAASGLLPPVFAAAAQSGPDFGILANSARLLRPGRRVIADRESRDSITGTRRVGSAKVADRGSGAPRWS